MSGMVNPNPIIRQPRETEPQPDTMSNRLDSLHKRDVDPVKVGERGEIKSGGFMMMLRSGLHAMFGIGKSTDDIKSNQETLNNLIGQLKSEAKQTMIEQNKQWKEGDFEKHWHIDPDKFAEKVVEQLLKSNTSLWGDSTFLGKTDPDVTIQQRIDRGSYLSGELSGQIKHQFDRIVRGTIDKTSGNMVNLDEKVAQQRAQARMRGQNLEVYGGVNDDSVSRFFNRELKNEGILPSLVNTGAKVIDDIKGTLDRLMGNESKTAFDRSLSQIREQGCKDYPSTDTKFWDTFQDYWSERVNAPKDSPMGKEFAFIEGKMRLFARDQARNGKIVDEKMLTEQLGKLLTHPFMTSRVQEMRNHNYISQCTPQDIANAIRLWRDQQPLEVQQKISQNDCDWLANQLEKSMESERLLMERAPSLGTGFKDWVSDFTSFGEKYDKFGSSPVLSRIYDTIAKNYEQMQVPGLMSDKQRFEFYKEKYGEKSLESVQEFFRPKAWGPDTLSKLVGDSINEVLLDRHDRIEQMMPELQKNRESREILQDNLTLFPSLKTQSNVFFEHPEMLKLNPTKPSQFINAIVHDPLVYAKTVDEMQRQIKTGAWKSTLPPEPKPPQEGAPKSEVDKYQEDKREYEKLVGEEHGRYMKEVVKQRDMMHELVDMNSGYFNVLDEVEEAVKELQKVDLSKLNDEEMQELGRKIDDLRVRSSFMFSYAFQEMNDNRGRMQLTDKEVTSVLGAVMSAWCDVDAILNDWESKAGRVQHEMSVMLRDTPQPEGPSQTLRESDMKLRQGLEKSLKALESGDPKAMAGASVELKHLLLSAFQTALPAYRGRGPDEPQAQKLLELITKAVRAGVELDRTPGLKDRKDLEVEGWKDLVDKLLPPQHDLERAKDEPPSYTYLRSGSIGMPQPPKPKSTNPFDDE